MQAELFDDPFDAADGDGPTSLSEFLGDDGGGGLGIEEAVANDLADDFVGAAVRAFGAAFFAEQGQGTALGEGLTELEVALFREAELEGGLQRSEAEAFPFAEHGEFTGDFIIGGHRECAVGTEELVGGGVEVDHEDLRRRQGTRHSCEKDSKKGCGSLIKSGGILQVK